MVEDKFEPKKLTNRELARLTWKEKMRYRWTRYSYLAVKAWNNVHLTLSRYFLVSGIFYGVCGTIILIGQGRVYEFVCDIGCSSQCDTRTDILMCGKNDCYKAAVNITIMQQATAASQLLYSDLSDASDDLVCNDLVSAANDPLNMMMLMKQSTSGLYDNSACFTFHCGVLYTARTDPDLYSDNGDDACTNVNANKADSDSTSCLCNSYIVNDGSSDISEIWGKCGLPGPTPSPTLAPTAAGPTEAPTGPSIRRLYDAVYAEAQPAAAPTPAVFPLSPGSQPVYGPWAALEKLVPSSNEVEFSATPDSGASSMSQLEFIKMLESIGRKLQTPTAPPSASPPTEFPTNYETEPWGLCTGLQQCVAGVKTRTVTCTDGPNACALPAPASEMRCVVDHCSDCDVTLSLSIVAYCYWAQGAVALMVFAVFALFDSRSEERREDMMVRVHFCMRPLGFICKNLPPLVRILVLLNFWQLAALVVQSWVPTDILDVMHDCNDSTWLRALTLVAFTIWVFQFIFGLVAKAYCRQEPWLYQPLRPGLLRPVFKVLGLLGP